MATSLRLFIGTWMAGAVLSGAPEARGQCTFDWQGWDGVPGVNNDVYATAVYDDGNGPALYVGGRFTIAGATAAYTIAKWDGRSWASLGSGVDGVSALAVYDGELIAAGAFTSADGTVANHVARWDGTRWVGLGSGTDGDVHELTVCHGELIAAGDFTTAGGTAANYIARWDGTRWAPLGSGMVKTGRAPPVWAVAAYNGELIAGGVFTTAGGAAANRIARWDGTSWAPLGSGMGHDSSDAWVSALMVHDGELVAGGRFTTAGGTAANRIAEWNGTRWAPLGTGLDEDVRALTTYNDELFAAADYADGMGADSNYIARWNGATWTAIGSVSYPHSNQQVRSLTVYDGELVVAGRFTSAGGTAAMNIAKWDGTTWSSLGSGMSRGGDPTSFISPKSEGLGFDTVYILVSEDVTLIDAHTSSTGAAAPSVNSLTRLGGGLHRVELSASIELAEWTKLELTVLGCDSGLESAISCQIAHLPADVNGDGEVNMSDVTQFGALFNAEPGDPDRQRIDLNGDGQGNLNDATLFGQLWQGTSGHAAWQGASLPPKP